MRFSRQYVLAILLLLALLAVPISALGSTPQPPASYYGQVWVDGDPAPENVEIKAIINGTERGAITTDKAGSYGGPGTLQEKMKVNGTQNDEGKTVKFFIGSIEANTTVKWAAGDHQEINFSINDTLPPTANAGNDRSIQVGEEVLLNASSSTDNIQITSYQWEFGDGTEAKGETQSYTYSETGEYDVRLTVYDASSNSDEDTITITVEGSQKEGQDNGDENDGDDAGGGGGGGGGPSIDPASAMRQLDEGVAQGDLSGGTSITQSKVILDDDATGIVEFEELVEIPSTSAPEVDKEFVGGVRTQIQGNEQGRIQIGIQRSHIEELNVDVNSLQIYKYHFTAVEWEPLETEVVRETDTEVVVEAETGFSDFVVFGESTTDSTKDTKTSEEPTTTTSPETTTETSTPTPTEEQTVTTTPEEPTAPTTTETETPGFGFLAVLVSLLAAGILSVRRFR